MPWDGSEARRLNELLRSCPELDVRLFATMLANRAASDTAQSVRPRTWLGSITDYAAGPLDRFGKPVHAGPHPEAAMGSRRAPELDHSTLINRAEQELQGEMPDTALTVAMVVHRALELSPKGMTAEEWTELERKLTEHAEGTAAVRQRIEQREADQRESAYRQAVRSVFTARGVSLSGLQRAMRLSYAHAVAYLDRMEREGLITRAESESGQTGWKLGPAPEWLQEAKAC